jgi:hypothetical protein
MSGTYSNPPCTKEGYKKYPLHPTPKEAQALATCKGLKKKLKKIPKKTLRLSV